MVEVFDVSGLVSTEKILGSIFSLELLLVDCVVVVIPTEDNVGKISFRRLSDASKAIGSPSISRFSCLSLTESAEGRRCLCCFEIRVWMYSSKEVILGSTLDSRISYRP